MGWRCYGAKTTTIFGKPFVTERGVKQGDIVSPTIFNIIIDAVVRHTLHQIMENNDNQTAIQFYEDDGVLAGEDYEQIQQMLELLKENFLLFGLEISIEKTEMMAMHAKIKHKPISSEAYDRKINGIGASYKEKQIMMTSCEWCNKEMQTRSIQRHQLSANCMKIKKQKLQDENYIISSIENEADNEQEQRTATFQLDMPHNIWTKCPHIIIHS